MVTTSTEDRALFKKLRFHSVVLDEAHMLKNMASQRYENLMKIKVSKFQGVKIEMCPLVFVHVCVCVLSW